MVHALGAAAGIGAVMGALALGLAAAGPGPGPDAGPGTGDPAGAAGPVTYVLPLPGHPDLVHPFAAPAETWAPGHRGVDLAGVVGQDVLAPADGTVVFAGFVVDRGVVTISHPDGLLSSLEPVQWGVVAGTRVRQGQVVGTVAPVAGHCSPATCVHWGVRRGDAYVDPLALVHDERPVVLLPGP